MKAVANGILCRYHIDPHVNHFTDPCDTTGMRFVLQSLFRTGDPVLFAKALTYMLCQNAYEY